MTATAAALDRLHFTGDDEADRLLASEPLALLIGFALDQQVPSRRPSPDRPSCERRIGHLDAARIAAMDRRGSWRTPSGSGRRCIGTRGPWRVGCRRCAPTWCGNYDGEASRVWTEATDGRDLRARLLALPSFGDMKARSLLAILRQALRARSFPGSTR